ncbi:hypothetical protein [Paraburkholderia aspalathi]|uniref:hypothetical protein n=1 Tax=Paraburkholderia aspalathi TaxID=1324617 RepID=UPI0011608460|nr:hypothetical protein [Paraburkholderia aspalathi]
MTDIDRWAEIYTIELMDSVARLIIRIRRTSLEFVSGISIARFDWRSRSTCPGSRNLLGSGVRKELSAIWATMPTDRLWPNSARHLIGSGQPATDRRTDAIRSAFEGSRLPQLRLAERAAAPAKAGCRVPGGLRTKAASVVVPMSLPPFP